MNSQRRHELQENELASALVRVNKKVEPYTKPIAVVLVLLVLGFFAWGLYSARQSDNRSDATLKLLEGSATGNSEVLAEVADDYPGTAASAWAHLYQGGEKMAAGIQSLFNSPVEADDLLTEASVAFENALAGGDDPVLRSRAYFGLGSIAESRGDAEAAVGYYESAMAAGESEAMAAEAQSRIGRLSRPQTKEFLAWFDQQNFAPDDPSLPPALPSAGMLPDTPDVSLPQQPSDASEAGESETEGTPTTEMVEPAEDASDEEPAGEVAPSDAAGSVDPESSEPPSESEPSEPEPSEPEPSEPESSEPGSGESEPSASEADADTDTVTETEPEPAAESDDLTDDGGDSDEPAADASDETVQD